MKIISILWNLKVASAFGGVWGGEDLVNNEALAFTEF